MNSADRPESIFDLCDEFEDSWAIDEHDAVRSFVDRLPSGNPARTELLLELVSLLWSFDGGMRRSRSRKRSSSVSTKPGPKFHFAHESNSIPQNFQNSNPTVNFGAN